MVVMETVRAATLASQRRKERHTASSPLAASSPRIKTSEPVSSVGVCPPSPILSNTSGNLPEELVRYRNQTYVAPEKLQIVKPLEGSVTLLKWKLLASPQLGGATSFFSDAAQPGVHRKKWKAGGVIDERQSQLSGVKIKSLSTTDISSLSHNLSYPLLSQHAIPGSSSFSPVQNTHEDATQKPLTKLKATSQQANVAVREDDESGLNEVGSSRSVLNQVGSLLGSGLSHFGFGGSNNSLDSNVSSKQESTGLSTLLDS